MPNVILFRNNAPVRRNNALPRPRHQDYFDDLREDFNRRCGYCDSFDLRRNNDFEVDHFIPRRVLVLISHTEYTNLVYSCKSCNRAKTGTWPSNDENVSLVGNTGFIDPEDGTYHTHFVRYDNGEIEWNSDLGKWMYRELALFNNQHAILFMLEKIRLSIEEGEALLNADPNNQIKKDGLIALYQYQDSFLNKLFNV